MLGNLIDKFKERRSAMNNLDNEYRMNKTLEQRRKPADERELERFMEEQRQKQISAQVRAIRKENNRKLWSGENNILKEPNIFKNHHSILTDNPNMSVMGKGKFL